MSKVHKHREYSTPTIDLGARVEDLPRVVGESRQMCPIFLAGNRLGGLPLLDIKNLNHVIIA